jgi:hypothetical protein
MSLDVTAELDTVPIWIRGYDVMTLKTGDGNLREIT